MKFTILALFLALSASGGTITVCNSGCDYSTAQAALNASRNGDTIVLTAGQSHGGLIIPGNRHDLTFKSSSIDTYPRGYRITRNNPALARLTTVTAGDTAGWVTGTPGNSTLTTIPGGAVQPHGLSVGDQVVVGGSRYSAYNCASLNQPPYTDGGCDATRVGFLNIRADTKLGNGNVLYFRGRTLPPPLMLNTPYYIVNFVRGGSAANADKFQVAATAGGLPIMIPQFNPAGQDFVLEVRPLPQAIGDTLYVVATPTPTTLQLSTTAGGTPVVWQQIPYGYNGGGMSFGFSLVKNAPVYNLTFDGIEVFPVSEKGVYYPFFVQSAIGSMAGEHHDIRIYRSWIHGADDQEDFPMATVNIAGRNLEIGWSIIEGAYSTGNDTQGIGFMSTQNVSIHDNEIKGATEGILSGGNFPWFAYLTNTTGISVYRNYIWKPLKAYSGIVAAYVSPTQFNFVSRYQGADCSTVATSPDLGYRCFAYEAQETPGTSTPPSNPIISRTEWTATAANSTFTANGTTGQAGYIYLLGGVFHMDYNYAGMVSCPAGVTCTFVATPSFPVLSTRIGIAKIGTDGDNVFDADSFYGENRNVWSKNLIESKYGDNWLMEGNVFHRQSNCDGGSTCQDPAIQFTLAGNGSGPADPMNYLVSSSNSIIRNNIFRYLSAGIDGAGKTFAGNYGGTGLNWEFAGFGQSINNLIQNNLFMDLGSTEYQAPFNGAVVRHQQTSGWVVQHNTAVDVRIGFLADQAQGAVYRSNVLTSYRSACVGYPCTSPAATTHIGIQNDPGIGPFEYFGGQGATSWTGAASNMNVDPASHFDNNIIMNRNGMTYSTQRPAFYPSTTWLVDPGDKGRDPNSLFMTWQERNNALPPTGLNYRAADYRLAAGMAAQYPAYDARMNGADIDEIEALTGKAGIDVENGAPTFAVRVGRTITAGSTSAVISYQPNGSTCTIKLWPNSNYSGNPTVSTTDMRAPVSNGMISVTISGLRPSQTYSGKRWCGPEVDVFTVNTLTSSPAIADQLQLAAPPAASDCVIEYGATPELGSITSAVAVYGGRCLVTVPASAVYWRYRYLSGAGTEVAGGDVQRRI